MPPSERYISPGRDHALSTNCVSLSNSCPAISALLRPDTKRRPIALCGVRNAHRFFPNEKSRFFEFRRRTRERKRLRMNRRTLSACEFVLGAGIVIGHNVYHLLPNEVPILFLLGLLSVRMRNGRWSAIGLKRPPSWSRIFLISLAAAVLRILLGDFVIEPLGTHFWPPIHAPANAEQITGNVKIAFLALLFVWTFAAFGEEIVYRGYLTLRAGRGRRRINRRLLGGDRVGIGLVWLRAFLQRADWNRRLRDGRPDPGSDLHGLGAESLGLHSGSRIYRYGRRDLRVFRLGGLGGAAQIGPCRLRIIFRVFRFAGWQRCALAAKGQTRT